MTAKVVMIVGADFEDSEFTVPRERLRQAGHEVIVMGSRPGEQLVGKHGEATTTVDIDADGAYPDDFDLMVIPGGYGPDRLRLDQNIVAFVRGFHGTGKPVAAICHGPQLLIEAEIVEGRTLTSWPSVRTDLLNAGAMWVDKDVVQDGNLITSRKPEDLESFCNACLTCLEAGEPG